MEPLRVKTPAVAVPVKWPAERRQRSRHKIFTPAYASFDGANALDLHEILDLHEGGLAAQAPATLDLNQNVSLRLVLSEATSAITANGRVVWADRGRLGIQLEQLGPEELKQLQSWLFLNALNAAGDDEHVVPPVLATLDEPAALVDRS
jgi:hypothetical protein